jgi:2-polyprenyl-6-methoxyphenol hydroxylase-like FAD-dependent oxidoreductase
LSSREPVSEASIAGPLPAYWVHRTGYRVTVVEAALVTAACTW